MRAWSEDHSEISRLLKRESIQNSKPPPPPSMVGLGTNASISDGFPE